MKLLQSVLMFAPSVLGHKLGFVNLVEEIDLGIASIYCVIQCQVLASKTLSKSLRKVLFIVV